MSVAYWIKGNEVIDIPDSHVNAIIRDPEHFGISMAEVLSAYRRHKEVLGVEGKARQQLVIKAIKNGHIRSRHYQRPVDYWTVQFRDWASSKATILSFLKMLLIKGEIYLHDDLLLGGVDDGFDETITVKNLLEREGEA